MPEVFTCVDKCSDDDDEFLKTDINQGSASQSNTFLQQNPNAIRLALYTDEFEIVNPIGSHRKMHKIAAFYWTMLNIPVEYRSKLTAIQLVALAKYMLDGLRLLYDGIDLDIPRYGTKKYFGKLCFVFADTLAANSLGSFKEGVGGANRPCRTCEVPKTEMGNVHCMAVYSREMKLNTGNALQLLRL
jgi:hypothetical protein